MAPFLRQGILDPIDGERELSSSTVFCFLSAETTRLAASKFLLPLANCTLNCTLAPLKSLLSRFLITAMENEMKTNASTPHTHTHTTLRVVLGPLWVFLFSFCALSVPFPCYTTVKPHVLGFSSPSVCYLYIPNPKLWVSNIIFT